jgi:hypothetical protein
MSSSLFVKYGVKAGGGPAFLKRTRTAFGQLQTRTRNGTSFNQLQTRTRTCLYQQTPVQWRLVRHIGCMSSNRFGYPACPSPGGWCSDGTRLAACATSYSPACDGDPDGHVAIQDFVCDSTPFYAYGGFSGWSATGSCSATCPACWHSSTVGRICRECRTATVCNWNNYTGWSNVSSCTVSSPGCPNTQTQCQTIYSFREQDWSEYEETDICTPQNPNPSAGALQIECVPQ